MLNNVSGNADKKSENAPLCRFEPNKISSRSEKKNFQKIYGENGVSVHYFCHFFFKMTGKTVLEYREISRFSVAKKILIATERSVEEIAKECGFERELSFVQEFVEREGLTPSEYRVYNKQKGDKQ